MNLNKFPVASTNLFPASNTTMGGQLLTEFNLRSRESVGTAESVEYMIGPSYVHSESDFYIRAQSNATDFFPDNSTAIISSTLIEMLPGKGVINGHFVELLTPIYIDIAEVNASIVTAGGIVLTGSLAIGLRIMYSTLPTMSGSILVEDSQELYEGVQVVILPVDEFKLPTDVPDSENNVTAHIKLATFTYFNGAIKNVVNNYPNKCTMIPASRIEQVDNLLSDTYIQKTGLNPKKLYSFAGKGTDPSTGLDTWCDSTDALMLWDANPSLVRTADDPYGAATEAAFSTDLNGKTMFVIPHKQVDYDVSNSAGELQHYKTKLLTLPLADYNTNTAGTVDKVYTQNVKRVTTKIHNLYNLPNGKQRKFIETLTTREIDSTSITALPLINAAWVAGDYILISQDETLQDEANSMVSARAPSSMYTVLPPVVASIRYVGTGSTVPVSLTGVELGRKESTTAPNTSTSDSSVYDDYWTLSDYRGVIGSDYFVYAYVSTTTTYYYYKVLLAAANSITYSEPIMLSGGVALAQEDTVGGFLNVPTTSSDYGYVYRDDEGHLRVLDYDLLRSGTLAYQLGEDFVTPTGLTTSEVQVYLDEYVNNRVSFPNYNQSQTASNPNVINITIYLSAETTATTLNLYDIDSRFNSSVYIHIYGSADSNTTINISDCEKVRIDSSVGGSPIINVYRSNLYYDCSVLELVTTISGMKLWYEKFAATDADLQVEYLTVRELNAPVVASTIDFWDDSTPNDNHFTFALRSITFSGDGTLVGCSLLVRNDMTTNVDVGTWIVAGQFTLPQGSNLQYPLNRLTKQLKVTGSFVSTYTSSQPVGYMVQNASFTALSQSYDARDLSVDESGTISFLVTAMYVTNITGLGNDTSGNPKTIDGWESNSFHIFSGSSLS